MPTFKYKATRSDGGSYESTMEAQDRFAVYRKIKSDGGVVLNVAEIKSEEKNKFFKLSFSRSKIKTQDKIIFARNLGSMIEAGLSLTRAISVMEKQTKNKKFKKILSDINSDISRGGTLSDSLRKFSNIFSPLFVSMVKAGEESGNLAGSLKTIAFQMDKAYALTRKVRGAMIYPGVIISLMVVIGILMMVYMVPTLTDTFKGLGIKLPFATRAIIAISDFLRFNFILVLLALVAIIFGFYFFAKSKKGKHIIDAAVLKLPIVGGIVKEVNAARTCRTLSSLLSAGVEFVVALSVTRDVLQNDYYKEVIEKAENVIEKGEPISTVFVENEKLYPSFVGEMVSVGEETGKMSEMLTGVAVFYEDEVDQKTKDMSTIIEPVLMILIGIAVGIFAISMLAPTYSLVDAI